MEFVDATQWILTAVGLSAAMLGCCLFAIIAYDAERARLCAALAVAAVALGLSAVAFAVLVPPALSIG